MHKIKKCSKLCVFLQSHKKIFSSCGFAFSKEDRLQGCHCIYCGGTFSFGENYPCISFDIILYIQSENMTIVFTKIVNMLAEVSAM